MSRSVGFTYAIAGTVVAASVLAVTAATLGLGGGAAGRGAEARQGAVPESIATASAIVPAGTLQPGEQVVKAEIVQTAEGPVQYLTVAPAADARRSHDDDDDEDDDDDHEEREHEAREQPRGTRRESR